MNVEEFRNYCISKVAVTESFPFDESVLVFKVMDKMFALGNIDDFQWINLKCDPEKSEELRAQFDGIKPGYHMSKKHWNTVAVKMDVPYELICSLIDESYNLVVSKLSRKQKLELDAWKG